MLIETLQSIAILFFSMVYPAYKTIKVIRKLEEPQMKLRLIKYW